MGCRSSVEAKPSSKSVESDSLKDVTRKLATTNMGYLKDIEDNHSMVVNQELRMDSAQTHKSNDSGIGKEFSDILCNKENQLATMNEQDIVDQLKKEGLLRPDSTKIKAKSMTFEVPLEELKVKSKRPPTRLAKLSCPSAKMENAEKLRLKFQNERSTMQQKKNVKLLEMHLASIDVDRDLNTVRALSSF